MGRSAVPYLVDALAEKGNDFQIAVIDVLGKMGQEAEDARVRLSDISSTHQYRRVREAAKKALLQIDQKR